MICIRNPRCVGLFIKARALDFVLEIPSSRKRGFAHQSVGRAAPNRLDYRLEICVQPEGGTQRAAHDGERRRPVPPRARCDPACATALVVLAEPGQVRERACGGGQRGLRRGGRGRAVFDRAEEQADRDEHEADQLDPHAVCGRGAADAKSSDQDVGEGQVE